MPNQLISASGQALEVRNSDTLITKHVHVNIHSNTRLLDGYGNRSVAWLTKKNRMSLIIPAKIKEITAPIDFNSGISIANPKIANIAETRLTNNAFMVFFSI